MTVYCSKCGTQLPDNAAFCMKCGANIARAWFARYDHKGNNIALVIDGNSGALINSIGI
jgi:hypothetical protein